MLEQLGDRWWYPSNALSRTYRIKLMIIQYVTDWRLLASITWIPLPLAGCACNRRLDRHLRRHDTAESVTLETVVRGKRTRDGIHARTGRVAGAVKFIAQIRAAPLHPLGNRRVARIITALWSLRINCDDLLGLLCVGIGAIPVLRPLPHVARHVIEAITVGGKGAYRTGGQVSVCASVVTRKLALPDIGSRFADVRALVPPRVRFAGKSAAGCKLPFGFGGQALPRPRRVGLGVKP